MIDIRALNPEGVKLIGRGDTFNQAVAALVASMNAAKVDAFMEHDLCNSCEFLCDANSKGMMQPIYEGNNAAVETSYWRMIVRKV